MVWTYRARHNPPKNEIFEWHLAAFFAVAEDCFD
jgi:hypothetical protein